MKFIDVKDVTILNIKAHAVKKHYGNANTGINNSDKVTSKEHWHHEYLSVFVL